jgi:hypothetical protein
MVSCLLGTMSLLLAGDDDGKPYSMWWRLPTSSMLATYHIRPLNQAFQSTFTCLSQLADSPEEEYNRNAFICSSSKGVTYIVHGILLFTTASETGPNRTPPPLSWWGR